MKLYAVKRACRFDSIEVANRHGQFMLPAKIGGAEHYLPVFTSMEAAREEYPMEEVLILRAANNGHAQI